MLDRYVKIVFYNVVQPIMEHDQSYFSSLSR